MIDNLGGRLGSFDRLEKELPDGAAGRASTARSAAAPTSRLAKRRSIRAVPLSRRELLQRSAAGALALAGVTRDRPRRPPHADAAAGAARGRARPGPDAGQPRLQRRPPGLRPALRRRPAARGRPGPRRGRRPGRRALGGALRRAAQARSGGHAYNGGSTSDDAVVIDLRGLDSVGSRTGSRRPGPGVLTRRLRRRWRAAARRPRRLVPDRPARRARDRRRDGARRPRARADARSRALVRRRDRRRAPQHVDGDERPVLGAARRRRQLRLRHRFHLRARRVRRAAYFASPSRRRRARRRSPPGTTSPPARPRRSPRSAR